MNRIPRELWIEFANAKHGDNYISLYIEFHKNAKSFLKGFSLLISFAGLFLLRYFEEYTWVAFVLIALIQIAFLFEEKVFKSTTDIERLIKLQRMYIDYSNKLERLCNQCRNSEIDTSEATKQYFSLRDKHWPDIATLDSDINIKDWGFLDKSAESKTHRYIKHYFGHE